MTQVFTIRTARTEHSKFTVEFKPGRKHFYVYAGSERQHFAKIGLHASIKVGVRDRMQAKDAGVMWVAWAARDFLEETLPKWYAELSNLTMEAIR